MEALFNFILASNAEKFFVEITCSIKTTAKSIRTSMFQEMKMHSWPDNSPAGTTQIPTPRSVEEFERYIKQEIEDVFEFGMKIKSYNIFYILLMKDKQTGQLGFSIMIGDRTILNLFTKGKQI